MNRDEWMVIYVHDDNDAVVAEFGNNLFAAQAYLKQIPSIAYGLYQAQLFKVRHRIPNPCEELKNEPR